MTATTLTRPMPRSFVPPGDRARRLAHLDPRPLWPEPGTAASPFKSVGFWAACAIVLPVAAVVGPVRALARMF